MLKSNDGNVPIVDTISIEKGIIPRLFTSFSIEPDRVERSGLGVRYEWDRQIQPGETWEIEVKTNYTLPFLLLILIIVAGVLVHLYTSNHVVVAKRVSHVRTKGGEFALKVILSVKAKKHVDNVQIIDRLPFMAKIYEKYGISPDRIDESTRRLFWDIKTLQAGEERVFSYIIYSKINVVGKFELPTAVAIYEVDGKTHESISNRALYLSETVRSDR
mgnify:FL=1